MFESALIVENKVLIVLEKCPFTDILQIVLNGTKKELMFYHQFYGTDPCWNHVKVYKNGNFLNNRTLVDFNSKYTFYHYSYISDDIFNWIKEKITREYWEEAE